MASAGDGACILHADQGSDADTFFLHGLEYGIIGADQNIGRLRSQYMGSLSGKLLRLDPETGAGVPSNPFWDPAHPRSVRSRTSALGLRNPFRFILKPGSGSHDPADGNPGIFFLGDVGSAASEELNVIDRPGLNLGWPLFEGMVTRFPGNAPNLAAPNPLYGIGGCTQQFFNFVDLIEQESQNPVSFPNPCDASVQIPVSWTDSGGHTWRYFKFEHKRPSLGWRGVYPLAPTFDASGAATTCRLGPAAARSRGSCSAGCLRSEGSSIRVTTSPPPTRTPISTGTGLARGSRLQVRRGRRADPCGRVRHRRARGEHNHPSHRRRPLLRALARQGAAHPLRPRRQPSSHGRGHARGVVRSGPPDRAVQRQRLLRPGRPASPVPVDVRRRGGQQYPASAARRTSSLLRTRTPGGST